MYTHAIGFSGGFAGSPRVKYRELFAWINHDLKGPLRLEHNSGHTHPYKLVYTGNDGGGSITLTPHNLEHEVPPGEIKKLAQFIGWGGKMGALVGRIRNRLEVRFVEESAKLRFDQTPQHPTTPSGKPPKGSKRKAA